MSKPCSDTTLMAPPALGMELNCRAADCTTPNMGVEPNHTSPRTARCFASCPTADNRPRSPISLSGVHPLPCFTRARAKYHCRRGSRASMAFMSGLLGDACDDVPLWARQPAPPGPTVRHHASGCAPAHPPRRLFGPAGTVAPPLTGPRPCSAGAGRAAFDPTGGSFPQNMGRQSRTTIRMLPRPCAAVSSRN